MAIKYDVAVSFAGEDRQIVERFVGLLKERNVSVFYDAWERADLWGKNLYAYLAEIYGSAARFCIIFVSAKYASKAWTTHELRSAQARALAERAEYILPVRLDDTELPGLPATIGYVDARKHTLEEIASVLFAKLNKELGRFDIGAALMSPDAEARKVALAYVAVQRLGEHGEKVVAMLLDDPVSEVRERAAWALDNLNNPAAVPSLLRGIHDHSWGVRSSAGWALVHLGACVKPEVQKVLASSPNPEAREMARLILERL